MKAYSYIRFSKQSQAKGDSYRRQSEKVRSYCAKSNLTLSTQTFEDLGISAWKGVNADTGALGAFIDGCTNGAIETPCTLLVENLDRISREHVRRAFSLLLQLLDLDVTIVTLMDEKVYSPDCDQTDLMIALVYLSRGADESETKSIRIREVKQAKRKKTLAGEVKFTGNGPKWLKLNEKTQTFEEIPAFVETLKRIYKMRSEGYGLVKILKTLNEEGTIAFTTTIVRDENGKPEEDDNGEIKRVPSKWSQTTLKNYLTTKAVLGEFQLKQGGQPVGEPIPDYFPRIISDELFYRVQSTFGKVTRGRTENFPNALVGLLRCRCCGGPVKFATTNPRLGRKHAPIHYLRCRNTFENKTTCYKGMIRYDATLSTVLVMSSYINYSKINSERYSALQGTLAKLESEQTTLKQQAENITNAIIQGVELPSLTEKAGEITQALSKVATDIKATKAELSELEPTSPLQSVQDLKTDTIEDRRTLNLFLKQNLSEILVDKEQVSIQFLSHALPEPLSAPLGLSMDDPEVIEDYISSGDLAINIDSYFEPDELTSEEIKK